MSVLKISMMILAVIGANKANRANGAKEARPSPDSLSVRLRLQPRVAIVDFELAEPRHLAVIDLSRLDYIDAVVPEEKATLLPAGHHSLELERPFGLPEGPPASRSAPCYDYRPSGGQYGIYSWNGLCGTSPSMARAASATEATGSNFRRRVGPGVVLLLVTSEALDPAKVRGWLKEVGSRTSAEEFRRALLRLIGRTEPDLQSALLTIPPE